MDIELMAFQLRRCTLGFKVSESPWFDSAETTAWFVDRLRSSKRYFEFGTGGSTYMAAKLGVSFVAVDSDWRFLRAVKRKIARDGYSVSSQQTFHYADIGSTGEWGRPVGEISSARLEQFRRYSDPPPGCFDDGNLPDLVLVDGRFRAACALKALRLLKGQQGSTIVVDDYVDRPASHVIADFAPLDKCVGRMAIFEVPDVIDLKGLDEAIRANEADSE
ncbi:hypothetical protein BH11ACT6_BH11ACT6_18470 [soil metagenome]